VTADLIVAPTADLEALDHSAREAALTQYLTGARDWLAKAVDITGPDAIASAKAEIATAAEAAKQLGLSKEIQLDAQEMVRRAEYALGKAVRRGQEAGEIAKKGDIGGSPMPGVVGSVAGARRSGTEHLVSPKTFFGHPDETAATYAMADDISPAEFDELISEAKAEGNLSRANIVRKANAFKGKDLSVQTACGIDNSFADGLKGVRSWLDTLTTNPTPEQAEALANTLRRYLRKIERNLP
jgi:hypothetical protein